MIERKIRCTAFSDEFIAVKKAEKHGLRRYTTIMFENNEAEWAQFLEFVYDTFGGPRGLNFTDKAIPGSARISPELLELTHDKFAYREATREDELKHLATLKGTHPFDPVDLIGGHVFGLGHFKKRPR